MPKQGPIAQRLIENAAAKGGWVYLSNCHLALSWLPTLDSVVGGLAHASPHEQHASAHARHDAPPLHDKFRLWLSSMPAAAFPLPLLQVSVFVLLY